jgi:hypothetical protein
MRNKSSDISGGFFDDGDHPYVKNVRHEGTKITVTFYDQFIGKDRDKLSTSTRMDSTRADAIIPSRRVKDRYVH